MTTRTLQAKLIVGTAAIGKAITSIQTRGKKLDADIQLAGLSILAHIEQHGDITLFENLWAAMPKGARKNALAEWALKYGKLSANTGADKALKPFLFNREATTDLIGAEDSPWYDFKPEQPVDQLFDFKKMMAVLMKKADDAEKKGLPIEGAEQLKAVRTAFATAGGHQ